MEGITQVKTSKFLKLGSVGGKATKELAMLAMEQSGVYY